MKASHPWPLRDHLVALLLVSMLPLLILGGFLIDQVITQRRQMIETELLAGAHYGTVVVDQEIRATIAALQAATLSSNLDDANLATFYQELGALRDLHPFWATAGLVDADGELKINLLRPFGTAMPRYDMSRDGVREAWASGRPAILKLQYGAVAKTQVIPINVPVTRQGKTRFLLFAAIRADRFNDLLTSGFSRPGRVIGLIDSHGTIITRSIEPESYVGRQIPDWLTAAVGNRRSGVVFGPTLRGEDYVFAFERSSLTGWLTLYSVPKATVEHPLMVTVGWLAGGAAATVAVSLLFAVLFARRVQRAATRLATASRQVLAGQPIGTPSGLPVRELAGLWEVLTHAGTELAASKAQYKALVDSFPGIVFRLRLAAEDRYEVLFVSEGCREMFDCTPADMSNGRMAQLLAGLPADERSSIRRERFERMTADQRFEKVWRADDLHGQGRWVHEFSHPVARERDAIIIDGYLLDVTEEMNAKLALQTRETEMSRVLAGLDLAGDGIAVTDGTGRILYVNGSMVDITGLGIGDAVAGRDLCPVAEAVIGANCLPVKDGVPSIIDGGEVEWRRPSDNRDVVLRIRSRQIPQGGSVVIAADVTEQRRRDQEQQRLERQLAQSRKMEALGRLAGGIAHDFNNLLGAMLGFAHFIVDDDGSDSRTRGYADRIIMAGRRAQTLISQILAFSNRGDAGRTAVPLDQVVEEFIDMLRASIPATTQISVRTTIHTPVVEAERGQMTQVLMNLCINANDALAGEPGEVTIELVPTQLREDAAAQIFAHSAVDNGLSPIVWRDQDGMLWAACGVLVPQQTYVSLVVSDDGCGINEAAFDRLFDPFFTTKGQGRGTGLGLAVVHGIVLNHRGAILVGTAPGRGTRFEVVLPLVQVPEQTLSAEDSGKAQEKTAAGHILLVDDSVNFCDMLMTFLDLQGHEVAACNSPEEALEVLNEHPHGWDLLITDQTMPGMTGADLVQAAKELCPDLSCIICTGYSETLTEDRATAAGAAAVVMKPIDLPAFGKLVSSLISRS